MLLFSSILCAYALTAGAQQKLAPSANAPINIYADYMKYDIQSGISQYKGSVRVTQDNIELTGDKVIAIQKDKILKKRLRCPLITMRGKKYLRYEK